MLGLQETTSLLRKILIIGFSSVAARSHSSSLPDLASSQETGRSLFIGDSGLAGQQAPQFDDQYQYNNDNHYTQDLQPHRGSLYSRVAEASARKLSLRNKKKFQPKWPLYFFLAMALQAIVCIVLEAYTFGQWETNLKKNDVSTNNNPDVRNQLRTNSTFLTLLIFGFAYQLILTWDALRLKNTIQIIGLVIANLILLIYTGLQIDSIDKTVHDLGNYNIFQNLDIGGGLKPLLIAIPCIVGVTTIPLTFIAWKLYQEFAWDILKTIGADYRMKQRYFQYQIYITLLKFDFFFFVGFAAQFLIIVSGKTDREAGIGIAALPIAVVTLIAAAFFTRKEWKWGVIIVILVYFCGLGYFIFKVTRIFNPAYASSYRFVKISLTTFAGLSIFHIITTLIYAVICMLNFGKGLKEHLGRRRNKVKKDQVSYSMNEVKQPQVPSQIVIE